MKLPTFDQNLLLIRNEMLIETLEKNKRIEGNFCVSIAARDCFVANNKRKL